MYCSHCCGIEKEFDQKHAARDLKRYRKRGPGKTTRWLLDTITAWGLHGNVVLDIGGGVGAITHSLLEAGARKAIFVEASSAYMDAAQEEARRQGHFERMTFLHGNFVDLAEHIPPADIVTLERVLCCYPDVQTLVRESAARAQKIYGLVYPVEGPMTRIAWLVINSYLRLKRNPFRVYLHPTEIVNDLVQSQGLRQIFYKRTLLWQIVVFAR